MKLTPWRPKSKVSNINDFFGLDHPFFGLTLFPELRQLTQDGKDWLPAIDVTEEKDHFAIKADLPGLNKEDIELSAEGTVLTIKGERKHEKEDEDKNFHRIERAYGQFVRRLDLGEPIDINKVKASYKNGVLEVTVQKSSDAQVKRIDIAS